MKIRPAAPNDIPLIDALLLQVGLPAEGYHDFVENFFVCTEGDQIVAAAGFEHYGEVALARSFAVDPGFQGQGLGRQLYEAVEKQAIQKKVKSLYLLTTTAQGYFERVGFSTLPRNQAPAAIQMTSEFRDLCPDSAVVMVHHLPTNS